MAEYSSHVLVCTNSENAEDRRHCGDKGGAAVRQKFNELLVAHDLIDKVTVNNVGCTSQHRICGEPDATVIVYGPTAELGGTWYQTSADDVEEIISEHLENGRVVGRLRNEERSVSLA